MTETPETGDEPQDEGVLDDTQVAYEDPTYDEGEDDPDNDEPGVEPED